MENQRKKNSAKSSMSKDKAIKPSSALTFEAFFSKCVKDGKLKAWQDKEIAAFFKDMKLRDKEDLEVYEAMLGKY